MPKVLHLTHILFGPGGCSFARDFLMQEFEEAGVLYDQTSGSRTIVDRLNGSNAGISWYSTRYRCAMELDSDCDR